MSKKSGTVEVVIGTGVLLTCAEMRWQRAVTEALTPFQLSAIQYVLLAGLHVLAQEGEIVTQAHLSRHVGADVMLTSKHVRVLEQRGLITRGVHPADSRARSLLLTNECITLLKQASKAVNKVDKALFGKQTSEKLKKHLLHIAGWE